MKNIRFALVLATALIAPAFSSHGAVQISVTKNPVTETSQLPGSALDYTIFGNGSQFPNITNYGGANNGIDSGVQTDFTITPDTSETANPSGGGSTINNPSGVSTLTGVIFSRTSNTNVPIVTLKLGTGSTTFNYADFNLYVMVGNAVGDSNLRDSAISLTDGTATQDPSFSDTNASYTAATFLEFTVTGASAGDTLVIGATSPNLAYLGGVSLESVPEPSTWAMMLGGFALLGVMAFRHRRASTL